VLVQAIKEERGNKGASLTTFISLAGRAAVLMPNSPKGGGISRKITDRETRKRLKEVAAEMRTHRGMSVIIRTAGIDRTKAEIRRDYEYLVSVWNTVREQTLAASAPALIYEEGNLIKRSLRDLYTSDVEEIVVQGEAAFQEAQAFMNMLMPSNIDCIKQYTGAMPLFSSAGVDDQLAAMAEPQVRLPSGGYLVIHPTEALISIDVNSGRSTSERNVEETAIKTNMEAAYEVARQLRLRDLAGLVVIDFIDMGYGKNRKAVERAMKDALKADRAKIQVGRISMFGLMELSRQRLRPSISESMGILCPHCKGTGYIHSVETVGIQIIRTLEKEAASAQYATLRVTTHPEAALYLLNEKRGALQSLEQRYNVSVVVTMDTTLITGNFRLIKVTADGREITHEPAVAKNDSYKRGGAAGGKPRRGRRGGRDESDNVVQFDSANKDSDSANAEPREGADDAARGASSNDNAPRGDRPRRERGGRDRNRGRDRDRNRNRGEGQVVPTAEASADAMVSEGSPVATDGTSPDAEGNRERSRRRGRRGGRNRRPAGERHPSGGGETGLAPVTTSESNYSAPVVDSARSHSTPEPQKSFVIPLSESQTNPAAVASPIRTESTGGDDKNKRKGWWSRVLES
jgi:ribonuclease E